MKDEEKRKLIKKYFPRSEWQRAWNVMQGESGGNPKAIGDTQPIKGVFAPSVGLFQIRTLPGRPSAEQLKNPEFNVKYAANMQSEQGWQPWTVAQKLGYTNGTKGVIKTKMENEELSSSFKERANAFREKARAKGWSSKKTEAFIDRKAEDELVRRGDIDVEEITDPSRQLKFREEGIEEGEPFKEGEVIDRTKDYLTDILGYSTREEAMNDLEAYKPIMEKEGVDTQLILDAINKKFPGEEEEPGMEGVGALKYTPFQKRGHEKIKSFFEKIFKGRTEEEKEEMWRNMFKKEEEPPPFKEWFLGKPRIYG